MVIFGNFHKIPLFCICKTSHTDITRAVMVATIILSVVCKRCKYRHSLLLILIIRECFTADCRNVEVPANENDF